MKILIILLFTFVSFTCLGQVKDYVTYRKQKDCFAKADSLVSAKEYAKASAFYKKALKYGNLDDGRLMKAARVFALNGQSNKAFCVLRKTRLSGALLCDINPENCWGQDPSDSIDILKINEKKWAKLLDFLEKRRKIKVAQLNYPLAIEFDKMLVEDQKYRYISITPEWNNLSKQQQDSLWVLQDEIDAKNRARLKQVTEQYGWPNYSMVGGGNTEIILNHAVEDYSYYIPIIEREAQKKEIDWRTVELIKQYYYVGRAELDEVHQIKVPFFKQTKPNLTQEAEAELGLIGDFLRYVGKSLVVIEVVYHGTLPPEKADALSQQRMKSVQSFFEKHYVYDSRKIVFKYHTFIPGSSSDSFPSNDNSVYITRIKKTNP
ncbi:MAG: hypothetical protein KA174_05100 [Chitinophagales bacterium]|nr:hypothetical protein [Chitinophagales bacterium]